MTKKNLIIASLVSLGLLVSVSLSSFALTPATHNQVSSVSTVKNICTECGGSGI